MKVAITGANGFLGSYLVKECLRHSFTVLALIRKGANTELLPDDENLHIVDVSYREGFGFQLNAIKEKHGPLDYFIHNAGLTVSLDAKEYYQVNGGLARTITEALEASSLLSENGKLVYISSYAANGPATKGQPVSHYGWSKKEAEEIIAGKFSNHLFVRPTAIYGAGDQAFLQLFETAKRGIYPVTSSSQRMTMVHAADLARMIIQDMQHLTGVVHCNDGQTYRHDDFIQLFEELFGKKVRKFPLPAWLAKVSIGASDLAHRIVKKKPNITLEKFEEISQHWDLHETELRHSSVKAEFSLKEGFKDALNYYQEKGLL